MSDIYTNLVTLTYGNGTDSAEEKHQVWSVVTMFLNVFCTAMAKARFCAPAVTPEMDLVEANSLMLWAVLRSHHVTRSLILLAIMTILTSTQSCKLGSFRTRPAVTRSRLLRMRPVGLHSKWGSLRLRLGLFSVQLISCLRVWLSFVLVVVAAVEMVMVAVIMAVVTEVVVVVMVDVVVVMAEVLGVATLEERRLDGEGGSVIG